MRLWFLAFVMIGVLFACVETARADAQTDEICEMAKRAYESVVEMRLVPSDFPVVNICKEKEVNVIQGDQVIKVDCRPFCKKRGFK